MSKHISNLELVAMEQRFKRLQREDALKAYRRSKASTKDVSEKSAKASTPETSFGKKLDQATAALLAASSASPEAAGTPKARTGFVVWRMDTSKDSGLPFNSVALVMEVGESIGDKIVLHHTDPDLIAVGSQSVAVPIGKIGSQHFAVYRDRASAAAAAERDNADYEAYKQTKKRR